MKEQITKQEIDNKVSEYIDRAEKIAVLSENIKHYMYKFSDIVDIAKMLQIQEDIEKNG